MSQKKTTAPETNAQTPKPHEAAPQTAAPQTQAAQMALRAKVYPVEGMGNLKAYAEINLCGDFAVRGLRVVEGTNGLFLSMPARKRSDGEYEDVFFPVKKESREHMTSVVLDAYHQCMTNKQAQQPQAPQAQGQGQSM